MRLVVLLFIFQIGVVSSFAQADTRKSVSRASLKHVTAVTLDGSAANRSATEAILSRIDDRVLQEMERAWRAAGGGVDNKEIVLLLFRMVDGSLEARPVGVTNEQKQFTFAWHPSAIAIVHTHPNSVDPRPSDADRKAADKLAVPIFTLTVRGMYVYDPKTRTVRLVQRGLDWLDLSKWKLSRF